MSTRKTKFILVTGGVSSSIGKGIVAASVGALLEARGLRIAHIKLDPYINVDPGTMNPFQHGEVFVTDDGTETDLDGSLRTLYVGSNLENSNATTGRSTRTLSRKNVGVTFSVALFKLILTTDAIKNFRTGPSAEIQMSVSLKLAVPSEISRAYLFSKHCGSSNFRKDQEM